MNKIEDTIDSIQSVALLMINNAIPIIDIVHNLNKNIEFTCSATDLHLVEMLDMGYVVFEVKNQFSFEITLHNTITKSKNIVKIFKHGFQYKKEQHHKFSKLYRVDKNTISSLFKQLTN